MIQHFKQRAWRDFDVIIAKLDDDLVQLMKSFFWLVHDFFYAAFDCLIPLDFCLTISHSDFCFALPFTLNKAPEKPQERIDDAVFDKFHSEQELLNYLYLSCAKCHNTIAALSNGELLEHFLKDPDEDTIDYQLLEIRLYNVRHVQHHMERLNMLLRQGAGQHQSRCFGRA